MKTCSNCHALRYEEKQAYCALHPPRMAVLFSEKGPVHASVQPPILKPEVQGCLQHQPIRKAK